MEFAVIKGHGQTLFLNLDFVGSHALACSPRAYKSDYDPLVGRNYANVSRETFDRGGVELIIGKNKVTNMVQEV